jgi:hypothetical protein
MNKVSLALIGVTAVGALALTACGDSTPTPTVTVTVPAPAPAPVAPSTPAPPVTTAPAPTTPTSCVQPPASSGITITWNPGCNGGVEHVTVSGVTVSLTFTGSFQNYSTSPMHYCLVSPSTTLAQCQGLSTDGTTSGTV